MKVLSELARRWRAYRVYRLMRRSDRLLRDIRSTGQMMRCRGDMGERRIGLRLEEVSRNAGFELAAIGLFVLALFPNAQEPERFVQRRIDGGDQ